jgi:proteasome lid subunit RPN8/RPN11
MGGGSLLAVRQLRLTSAQLESMRAHVEACLPLEACGLLAGSGDTVQKVIPVSNEARSPVRFRMSPVEQLHSFDQMEREGLDLIGIFHSHPAGPERPSATDIAEAAYEVVYVIWSRFQDTWSANGFWIHNQRASEVKLSTADCE